jgi:hypothetical protein
MRAAKPENALASRSFIMTSRVFALLLLSTSLAACASDGGGPVVAGSISVSNDGVMTRAGRARADLAFIYADKDCLPLALDEDKTLLYLGDPQKVVRTNDYIGTRIYAVAPGTHTLAVHSEIASEGLTHEALPSKTTTFQARHFYGVDCVRNNGKVDIAITDRDHLGRGND